MCVWERESDMGRERARERISVLWNVCLFVYAWHSKSAFLVTSITMSLCQLNMFLFFVSSWSAAKRFFFWNFLVLFSGLVLFLRHKWIKLMSPDPIDPFKDIRTKTDPDEMNNVVQIYACIAVLVSISHPEVLLCLCFFFFSNISSPVSIYSSLRRRENCRKLGEGLPAARLQAKIFVIASPVTVSLCFSLSFPFIFLLLNVCFSVYLLLFKDMDRKPPKSS